MAELVVACFDTQFDANAAAEKLLSRGLRREQVLLVFDESIGGAPSSSSAPTTVISKTSHTGTMDTSTGQEKKSKRVFTSSRTPDLPDPALIGHTTLVIELHGEMSMDDVCALLDGAGASSISSQKRTKPQNEDASMWPAVGAASAEDVQRSKDASKGGDSLGTHRHHR